MSVIHREVICVNTLQTNDWLILNSIIYEIYTTADFDGMRKKFLEQMKMLVDFDSADFYLAAADGEHKLTAPVMYHCDEDLSDVYDTIDYGRGILYSGKSIVYRETDIMADEVRTKTEYYDKIYKPNRWHYSLQMIIAKDKQFLGVVTLYRNIGKDDFTHDEVYLVEGKDNSFICDYLSISINTLKKHILNIYRKLGIRNRVQLFKKIREKE